MFRFLRALLKRPVVLPDKVSAEEICRYLRDLKRTDDRRLDNEIRERGLAFGDLRVDSVSGNELAFRIAANGRERFPVSEVKQVLGHILRQHHQSDTEIIGGFGEGDLEVVKRNSDDVRGEGQLIAGLNNGQPFRQKTFLTVETHWPRFKVYGEQGLGVVLDLVKYFGFTAWPAHFAYESAQPLEEIVSYCYSWRDPASGKYYTEVKYDSVGEKSQRQIDAQQIERFDDGDGKIVVLGGSKPPRFKLNNQVVSTRRVREPTPHMLQAIDQIRADLRRQYTCHIKDCGREAAHEVSSVYLEMGDDFSGGMSMGGISYACNSHTHLEQVKAEAGGIRQEVRDVRLEIW